jgi:hypothetical protein
MRSVALPQSGHEVLPAEPVASSEKAPFRVVSFVAKWRTAIWKWTSPSVSLNVH